MEPVRAGLRQRPEAEGPVRPVSDHDVREGHEHDLRRSRPAHRCVSGHELSVAARRHVTTAKLNEAIGDVVDRHAQLDLSWAWGNGTTAAADGTNMDTYLDNLLAETSVGWCRARRRRRRT
ncbi:Tn3 family transposase [Streptomyces anulatus]|uniref:Tn3 family transposase n=1 Tax=Streptomyces anulatus TaxID=1892 RepID=UPI00369E5658